MLQAYAQVIRFEQRGCGRSTWIGPYDLETCLLDLEAVRSAYGIDRWIIVGHSWGADLAVIYALEHSQNLISFICVSGGRVNDDRQWYEAYKGRWETEPRPIFQFPQNMQVNQELSQSWKRYIKRRALLHDLSRLEVPALFIYGDQDIRPSWPAEQVANLLPQGRFHMTSGAGHCIWFTHAAEMEAVLTGFIRRWE
jgi:proline iminopeptidase